MAPVKDVPTFAVRGPWLAGVSRIGHTLDRNWPKHTRPGVGLLGMPSPTAVSKRLPGRCSCNPYPFYTHTFLMRGTGSGKLQRTTWPLSSGPSVSSRACLSERSVASRLAHEARCRQQELSLSTLVRTDQRQALGCSSLPDLGSSSLPVLPGTAQLLGPAEWLCGGSS